MEYRQVQSRWVEKVGHNIVWLRAVEESRGESSQAVMV